MDDSTDAAAGKPIPSAEPIPPNVAAPAPPPASLGPAMNLLAVALGFGFWVVVIVAILATFNSTVRIFLLEHWVTLVVLGVAGLCVLGVVVLLRGQVAAALPATRQLVVAFGFVPVLLLLLLAMVLLPVEYQLCAVKLILVTLAATMPAGLQYLFLATRRPTILNEFIANLDKLGLLRDQLTTPESPTRRQARVDGYLQKFESVYGALRFEPGPVRSDQTPVVTRADFVDLLLRPATAGETTRLPQPIGGIAAILNSNIWIPVALATLLAGTGWLMVLQPDVPGLPWRPVANSLEVPALTVTTNQVARTNAAGLVRNPPPADVADTSATAAPMLLLGSVLPGWTPVNFAFLGAYAFGLQLLFRRFTRRDLGQNALLAFANRILLAVIATWAAMACFSVFGSGDGAAATGSSVMSHLLNPVLGGREWPSSLLITAFVIGSFPRMLWQIVSAALTKILFLRFAIPSFEAKQPVSEIDGLTVWHEARLEEEDIENVPNLATVDIVHLLLHTQNPPERLMDWVDQAILLKVIGPATDGYDPGSLRTFLRSRGIRTATELVSVVAEAQRQKIAWPPAEAKTLNADPVTIAHMIAIEGNFDLVWAWRGLGENPLRPVPPPARP